MRPNLRRPGEEDKQKFTTDEKLAHGQSCFSDPNETIRKQISQVLRKFELIREVV
jgi:hypothetical protein